MRNLMITSADVPNLHRDSREQRKIWGYVKQVSPFVWVLIELIDLAITKKNTHTHIHTHHTHTHTHTQLIHKRSPVSINASSEPSGVRPSNFVLLIHLLQTAHNFILSQAHGVLQTSCTLSTQISCNCAAQQNLLQVTVQPTLPIFMLLFRQPCLSKT
jgi:hypothetical protein